MSEQSFNPRNPNATKTPLAERTESTNKAGGRSWGPDDARFGLYKNVINNLLEDTYYQSAEEQFSDVVEEFLDVYTNGYGEFPLQLATYARHEGGYRDIAQILLVLSANVGRRDLQGGIDETGAYQWNKQETPIDGDLIAGYTPSIIDRADEFNTVVALQLALFGTPLPRPLRRGIEDALHKRYAIVEVGYAGMAETERVTFIDNGDGQGRQVARDRAAMAVLDRNDIHVPGAGDPFDVDRVSAEVKDSGYVFDDYTFAKYMQRNREVSLQDVFNLVRPNPRTEDREELFERLMLGELDDNDVEPLREDRTWESTRSDDEDDRSEAEQWRDSLDDMGLMARVRNVRNMLQAGLTGADIFDYDGGTFGEESARRVREHQMFPFRYYQAFKAIADVGGFGRYGSPGGFKITADLGDGPALDWLNEAMDASVEHLPDRFESTFTAIDLSGSMDSRVSNNSDLVRAEIATLFGSIVTKYGGDVGAFGSSFQTVDVDDRARETHGSLDLAREIYKLSESVGNRTYGHLALEWAINNEKVYDRFVFFTDEQLYRSTVRSDGLKGAWDRYTDEINPDAHLYIIDLSSYGDLTMPPGYHNVHQISGWNSEVIEFIDQNEGAQDVIADIAAIEPGEY